MSVNPSSKNNPVKRLVRRVSSLLRDRRGVAAVEFAFIAPVLLSLYFVTMEVSQGIETNKKVGRIASMVADLVTQQPEVSTSNLDAIMRIGAAIIQPYGRTRPDIEITGIRMSDEENPRPLVVWSRRLNGGSFSAGVAAGTEAPVPDQLRIRNTFLVQVASSLDYRPVITWAADNKARIGLASAFDRIAMREQYFLRPRMSQQITCTNC
jgi:Flp pilus assembly protein TadG